MYKAFSGPRENPFNLKPIRATCFRSTRPTISDSAAQQLPVCILPCARWLTRKEWALQECVRLLDRVGQSS